MNDFKFKGQIEKIFDVKSGESDRGEWKSIEFLVAEVDEQYPQSVSFRLFGADKVDNFVKYNEVGDLVEVSFNIKSREYEGKYYNSIDAWKVWKENPTTTKPNDSLQPEEDDDDLPF